MSVKINKGSALASLSITPLIDIVFLLIIFFMVGTKFSMNATPQCYDYEVGSPGWSFFY